MQQSGDTLGRRFDPKRNGLNALRLLFAVEVVVWHSYALGGGTWLPRPVSAFLGDIGVDSFFAISGFLICRSWQRRPQLGAFLLARARRILPGLWVCLLVTAFVVAPVAAAISGTTAPSVAARWHYVLANADVWVHAWGIGGGPVGVPMAGSWNGSLWSLGYEGVCYLVVAGLGLTRLLRPRVVVGIAAGCWIFSAALTTGGLRSSGALLWCAPRCGLMFACGALAWFYRDRIPASRLLCALCAAAVLVGVVALPNYRLLAAPAVAYLCLVGGSSLGRFERLVIDTDLSYGVYVYGFVIQQALLLCGFRLGWAPFAVLSLACVLPVAALSWFAIERPVLGRKRQETQPHTPERATGLPMVQVKLAEPLALVESVAVAVTE